MFTIYTKELVHCSRTSYCLNMNVPDKPKPAMKRSLSADLQIKKKKNHQGLSDTDRLDVTPPKKLKTDPQPFLRFVFFMLFFLLV